MRDWIFITLGALLLTLPAHAEEVDLAAYQAYEGCVKDAMKARAGDILRIRPLDTIRKNTLDETEKCLKLLPNEAKEYQDKFQSTVVLLTAPKPKSGVEKGPVSVTAGTIVQTTTGASLYLAADAQLTFPKQSVFALTEGARLRLSGAVAIGSTAEGQSTIPMAKVKLEGGRQLDIKVDDDQKAQLEERQVNLAGFNAASVNEIIRLTFDRNAAMDRPWDISAAYGREVSVTGPTQGVALNAVFEGGVGESGAKTLPYLRLTVGANAYICKTLGSARHLLCASADVAVGLGVVQAKLDVGASVDYRYVTSDRADSKKWFHSVSIGPKFREELQGDLAGGHASSQGFLMLTID